ncbi:hypothetical protein [Burkholderia phage vB_BpP_HN03]|uniref:Uncharacterized protein n=1 Tax=Burkholderia phage vB_BpP_HN02 TaxID=3116925 RepID=A0AAX4JJ33_9CAUD
MQIIYNAAELASIVERNLRNKFGVPEGVAEGDIHIQFAIVDGETKAFVGVGEFPTVPQNTLAPWEERPHVSIGVDHGKSMSETVASLSTSLSTAEPQRRTRRTKAEMEAFRQQQQAEAEAKQAETGNESEVSKSGDDASKQSQATDANQQQEAGSEQAGSDGEQVKGDAQAEAATEQPTYTPAAEVPIADPNDTPPAQPDEGSTGNAPVESTSQQEGAQVPTAPRVSLFAKNKPDASTTGTAGTTASGDAPPASPRPSLFAGLNKNAG